MHHTTASAFQSFQSADFDLLRGIRTRIEAGQTGGHIATNPATRSLLFLYAAPDETLKNKLDRHLAAVKKKHGLRSVSILILWQEKSNPRKYARCFA